MGFLLDLVIAIIAAFWDQARAEERMANATPPAQSDILIDTVHWDSQDLAQPDPSQIKPPRASRVYLILTYLSSRNPGRRKTILDAINEMDLTDRRVLDAVRVHATQDPDSSVRRAARDALSYYDYPVLSRSNPQPQPSAVAPPTAPTAARTPRQLAILQNLASPESKHRESTLKQLTAGDLEDPQILQTVQELAVQSQMGYVRQAAASTLKTNGYPVPEAAGSAKAGAFRSKIAVLVLFAIFALLCPIFLPFSCLAGCPDMTEADLMQITLYCAAVMVPLALVGLLAAIVLILRHRNQPTE